MLCVAAAATVAASPSAKYDKLKVGPAVGEKIPRDLKSVDQNREIIPSFGIQNPRFP